MKLFEEICRKSDIKITFQRMEIYRELVMADDHPDAETVYKRVKEKIPTISLDTVYRALWLFNDLGLIKTLSTPRESTRFDANLDIHHHFVCTNCGLTIDFYSQKFNELDIPESINEIGQPLSTHVEVRGICKECAKKISL